MAQPVTAELLFPFSSPQYTQGKEGPRKLRRNENQIAIILSFPREGSLGLRGRSFKVYVIDILQSIKLTSSVLVFFNT